LIFLIIIHSSAKIVLSSLLFFLFFGATEFARPLPSDTVSKSDQLLALGLWMRTRIRLKFQQLCCVLRLFFDLNVSTHLPTSNCRSTYLQGQVRGVSALATKFRFSDNIIHDLFKEDAIW